MSGQDSGERWAVSLAFVLAHQGALGRKRDWLRSSHQMQDVVRGCGHTLKVMFEHTRASRIPIRHSVLLWRQPDQVGEPVVAPVVASAVVTSSKQESPDLEVSGDSEVIEVADEDCELVTVGGDRGDHHLMDLIGLEPTTSSMPWKRSSN
jgi:hypothetical protein